MLHILLVGQISVICYTKTLLIRYKDFFFSSNNSERLELCYKVNRRAFSTLQEYFLFDSSGRGSHLAHVDKAVSFSSLFH